MPTIKFMLGAIFRDIHYNILFNWILRFKSQPLSANKKPAIVFAPHQDDETLGCGGMIALKRSLNVPVKVVFLTDGRYGRPDWITPEEIITYRQKEATNAASSLGLEASQISFIGETDGTLSKLSDVQRQNLIQHLVCIIQAFNPLEIYVPYRKDAHPDHEATYELVRSAIQSAKIDAELLQYQIWGFWRKPFDILSSRDIANPYKLFIGSVREHKKRAIENYQSQVPNLPSVIIKALSSEHEIFFKN